MTTKKEKTEKIEKKEFNLNEMPKVDIQKSIIPNQTETNLLNNDKELPKESIKLSTEEILRITLIQREMTIMELESKVLELKYNAHNELLGKTVAQLRDNYEVPKNWKLFIDHGMFALNANVIKNK